MKIGLVDVDGHNYPNLPLMKLSAWHKSRGDHVEWYSPIISGHNVEEPERDYLGNIICHCAGCDWCKSLEDSAGRTIYFCMNADSTAYLEETGLLGGCTFPPDYEMPEEW